MRTPPSVVIGLGSFTNRKKVLTYSQSHESDTSPAGSGTWALAKKMFAYKFNSYVVSTERETKNLQPELSHRIHSRACQHVKSPIKAPRQWCPSQLLLRVHFLKRHLPKMCNRLRTHYPIDWALRVDGVLTATPRIVHPPPLSRHAPPPHATTLPPPSSLRPPPRPTRSHRAVQCLFS